MDKRELSRTISYKSTLDISEVLSSVKQLQKEVSSKHNDVNLFNVDKELANLEKIAKQYKDIMSKGISSVSEAKEINRLGGQIESTISRIDKAFDKIDYDIAKNAKNALKDTLQGLKGELQTVRNSFEKTFQSVFTNVKGKGEFKNIYKEAAQEGKNFQTVQKEILDNFDKQIEAAKKAVSKASGTAFTDLENFKSNPFGNGIILPTNIYKRSEKNEQNSYAAIQKIFLDIAQSEDTAEEKLKKFKEELKKVGVELNPKQADSFKWFNVYADKLDELQDKASKVLSSREYTSATAALEKLETQRETIRTNTGLQKSYNEYSNLIGQVNDATKALDNFDESAVKIERGNLPQAFDSLSDAVSRETTEVMGLTTAQVQLDNTFNSLQNRLTQLLSLGTVYTELRQIIRQTYNDVKELDKAFGEIAMVTNYTVQDLWGQYDNYAAMANRLGQSTVSVIQASGLFYQQGLETSEALALTEDTMKLATLAGLDFADATSQMTAAIRAFKLEMTDGSHVTDVYAELAAHAAADVQGIATAMSKTASIANSAGMSFENTATFLTTMIEATQEAPDNIGTALKTVIARFTELKENVAGAADSAFDDLDYNKVDKALKSVGISIKDVNGQFRNLDEVFLELGEKWSTLDRNTQRYIATIAAGSRQQSRFVALLDNYDRVKQLQEVAANAEGRADEQFAKFADTLEYKVNQLKNSWEQLRTSFLNSDFFKGAVDGITNIVNKIKDFKAIDFVKATTAIVLAVKVVGPKIIAEFQKIASSAGQGMVNKINDQLSNIGKKFSHNRFLNGFNIDIKTNEQQIEAELTKLGLKYEEIDKEIENNPIQINIAQQGLSNFMQTYDKTSYDQAYGKGAYNKVVAEYQSEITRLQQRGQDLKASKKTIDGLLGDNKALKAQATARGQVIGQALSVGVTTALSAALLADNPMDAIKTIMITGATSLITQLISIATTGGAEVTASFIASTAGIGAIILAATAAVTALGFAIKNAFDEAEAQKFSSRMDAAAEAAKTAAKEAEEAKNKAKSEKQNYEDVKKLKEEYDRLNKIQVKSTEEQEQYNELVEKIRDEYPEVVSYYNEATGELRTQNDLWDSIIEKQEKSAIAAQKLALATQGASLSAQTVSNRYKLIDQTSSNTGLNSEFIEQAIGKEGSYGITKEMLMFTSGDFVDDIDKIAQYAGVISEDGVFSSDDYQKMADALNDGNSELRQAISGLEDQVEDNVKELINNTAALVSDQYALEHPDAGAGEKLLAEAVASKMIEARGEELTFSAEEYRKAYGVGAYTDFTNDLLSYIPIIGPDKIENNLFNALGGGMSGDVTSNNLDKWKKLDKNATFQGLELYGLKTVEDFKNAMKKIYGEENASDIYDAAIADTEKFDLILNNLIKSIQEEQAKLDTEDLIKNLSDKDIDKINTLIDTLYVNGATQKEVSQAQEFLSAHGLSSDKIDKLEIQLQELVTQALKNGLSDTENWSDVQLTAWNEWIESLQKTIGGEAAQEFGKKFSEQAQAAGLSPEQITAAFQSVKWGEITFDSIGDAKERFVSTMQDAMGDSFDSAKVDQLWEQFFATAEKYNVVNVEIKSVDVMNNIRDQVMESYDKIVKASSDVQTQVKKQLTDGHIDFSDYRTLQKTLEEINLDVNDYVELTEKGYELNSDKMAQALAEQASDEDTILEQAKAKIKLGIDELNNEIAILDAMYGQETLDADIIENLKSKVTLSAMYARNILRATGQEDKIADLEDGKEVTYTIDKKFYNERRAELEKQVKELQSYLDDEGKLRLALGTDNFGEVLKEIAGNFDETYNSMAETADDTTDKISKAWDKVQEAQQKVIDKQKELKELTEGTAPHQTAGDPMYNYTTKLAQDAKQIEKLKSQIEDLSNPADRKDLLSQYTSAAHNEIVTREAQNQVYQQGADRILQTLRESLPKAMQQINSKYGLSMSTNFADYMQDLGNGRMGFQWSKFNDARIPQDVEKYFAEQIQAYDEQLDKIDENREAIEKRQKEFNEFYKKQLDDYVSLEDEVVNKLKEKYQEEIDNVKDKNEAIEDANNDYLDALEKAIDKERSLRDRQREWDDLATQEKKLSLMQRDTSGANRVETAKLEKDIEKQREDLLDKSVDDIINNLKELYETQQEAREAEVEYMEAMLDNAALVREANEIITSWQSPEDAVNWWKSVTNMQELSNAKQEQEALKWQELYEKRENYLATSQEAFNDALQVSEAEIQLEVETTGDNVVASVDQNFASIVHTVDEAIAQVIQDIADGKKAVDDALKDYYDLLKDDAEKKGNSILEWLQKVINELKKNNTTIDVSNGLSTVSDTIYEKAPKYDDRGFRLNTSTDSTLKARNISNAANAILSTGTLSVAKAQIIKIIDEWTRNGKLNNVDIPENKMIDILYSLDDILGKGEGDYSISDLNSFLKSQKINYIFNKDAYTNAAVLSQHKYAQGGLVPYTGPAWVDGTPSRPEAFLSADDTERIGQLTQLLENIPFFNSTIPSDNISTTNIGDTTIEVNITIENVSSDYDVDQAVERVKQDIVSAARYTGSNVILKQ